jgi:hypothetical protein
MQAVVIVIVIVLSYKAMLNSNDYRNNIHRFPNRELAAYVFNTAYIAYRVEGMIILKLFRLMSLLSTFRCLPVSDWLFECLLAVLSNKTL